LILASIDRVKALLDALEQTGKEPQGNDGDLIGELQATGNCREAEGAGGSQADSAAVQVAAEHPAATAEPARNAPNSDGQDAGKDKNAKPSIRVQVSTLDRLMTMVSELVLTRNQLIEIGRRRADTSSNRRCSGCPISPPNCRRACCKPACSRSPLRGRSCRA
jgi:two-component system chemotaxis sensor kinase CheA